MAEDPYLCSASALSRCRAPKSQADHEVWCTGHVIANLMSAAIAKAGEEGVDISTACVYFVGRAKLYADTGDEQALRLSSGCTLDACLRGASQRTGVCTEQDWPSRTPFWNDRPANALQPSYGAWRVTRWENVPRSVSAVRKLLNAGIGVGFVLCMDDHTAQWMKAGGEALSSLRPIGSPDETINHAMYIEGYTEDVSFDDVKGAFAVRNSNGRRHHKNSGMFFMRPSLLRDMCVRDLVAIRGVQKVS